MRRLNGRSSARAVLGVFAILFLAYSVSCRLLQHTDLSGRDPATRTIFVHNFTNQTFQPDIQVELADALKNELARRDNFKVVATREAARLWVYGDIVVFSREGRMYDNFRNPTRYEMVATVRIKLRENAEKAGGALPLDRSGEVSQAVQYSEKEGYTEPEAQARARMARILASKISDSLEAEYLEWQR